MTFALDPAIFTIVSFCPYTWSTPIFCKLHGHLLSFTPSAILSVLPPFTSAVFSFSFPLLFASATPGTRRRSPVSAAGRRRALAFVNFTCCRELTAPDGPSAVFQFSSFASIRTSPEPAPQGPRASSPRFDISDWFIYCLTRPSSKNSALFLLPPPSFDPSWV